MHPRGIRTLFPILDLIAFHDEPIDFKRGFHRKLRNFRFDDVIHGDDFGIIRFVR